MSKGLDRPFGETLDHSRLADRMFWHHLGFTFGGLSDVPDGKILTSDGKQKKKKKRRNQNNFEYSIIIF